MKEQLVQSQKNNSLDDLLEQRVGYGPGQSLLLRSLYILLFAEGCETIVIGLIIPKIGVQWNMGTFEKSALITMVYLGVSIGSYLETYSDTYGRYKFLLGNAILTSVFGLISVFATTFYFFLVTRFFYGIGIGIILPLTATYITEIVPGSSRGKILTMSRVYWSLGNFTACVLGWFLLTGNHWRILLFILCLPNFFSIYDVMKNCRESLRYSWVRKNKDEVIDVINTLTENNGRERIPEEEIMELMSKEDLQESQKSHFSELFNEKYCKITIIFIVAWTTACFIYYAVMLILPTILARHTDVSGNFQYIFLMVISAFEVVAYYSSQYIMDSPYFGRKKSVYLLYFAVALFTAIIIVTKEGNLIILLVAFIGIKIFSTSGIMVLYPYSAEIYETMIRSTAMGIFSLAGRIATTVLVGIIGISATQWMGGMGLYYLFILLSLATSILVYQMPFCTLGRKLDI